MSKQGHVFIDESNHAIGRAEGWEACRALWALTDADQAASALASAANRLVASQGSLTFDDWARIQNIAARTRLVIDLMMSILRDTA